MLLSGGRVGRIVGRILVGKLEGSGKLVSGTVGNIEVTDPGNEMLGKESVGKGRDGTSDGVGIVTRTQLKPAMSPCEGCSSKECIAEVRRSLTRFPPQQTVDPSHCGVGTRGSVLMSTTVQLRPTSPIWVELRLGGNMSVMAAGNASS